MSSLPNSISTAERRERGLDSPNERERFCTMVDSCQSMMWVTGIDGSIEILNRAYREFCGLSDRVLDLAKWESLVHPEDVREYLTEFNRAMATRTPFTAEGRMRRADGEWRLVGSRHAEFVGERRIPGACRPQRGYNGTEQGRPGPPI